ncbi:MAG: hypothetical protein ACRET3_09520 [Burkholderiales bacterium]
MAILDPPSSILDSRSCERARLASEIFLSSLQTQFFSNLREQRFDH